MIRKAAPKDHSLKPCVVVLAAGQSSRFGGDKLLHPMSDGRALIAHTLDPIIQSELDFIVVTRPGHTELAQFLRSNHWSFCECPLASSGMSQSIKFGVEQMSSYGGWLIALADMPYIASTTFNQISEHLNHDQITVPVFQKRQGHPVGFGRAFLKDFQSLSGDVGARALLARYPEKIDRLEIDDPEMLYDVDCPEQIK